MAVVLVIGDTHCPGMRTGYVDFLKRIADRYSVTKVVHIGDLVDWASINFHERNPAFHNPSKEFSIAFKQVQQLAKAFPKVDWMLGNHDVLTERQAQAVGLPTEVLKSYNDLWEIDWKIHPRYEKHEIDGALYSHGECGKGGQDAAIKQAKDQFQSMAIGHYHSQAGVKYWANHEHRIFGLSVGTGMDRSLLQFEYGVKFVAKPLLGCGVVLGGKRAFFEPWLLDSK